MGLVPDVCGDLADRVDKVNTGHPLIGSQLDLTGEVVQVTEQAGQDLAVSGGDIGAHGVDDMLGEVRVETRLGWRAIGTVGSHFCEFEKGRVEDWVLEV